MPAEWHFFATSRGKSAYDGVGGTLRRLAAKASLQRPYNDQKCYLTSCMNGLNPYTQTQF
jgi:hypothetical protein